MKPTLHPRNRHQGRYDFPRLIQGTPELGKHVILNPYGKESIDFADPAAVRVFNRALLKALYGIQFWDIPEGYLCPPVPGRADYVHGVADLLAEDHQGTPPTGAQVRVLDIGTGANCIYPLLGHLDYRWRFIGSDIDPVAVASAQTIAKANGLGKAIELRLQAEPRHMLDGVVRPEERFAVSLCNPPFHASAQEALSGSQRKWRNLGKADPSRTLPILNFGGQQTELWCEGGELSFVSRLIDESLGYGQQIGWFTCLVSKAGNLAPLQARIARTGALATRVVAMGQGQKQSRFLAWTFQTPEQRQG
jgi:23S rRNA (adenine1618-N6)-methyltransferase